MPANHAPGRCYMSPGSLLLEAATWEVPRNSWPHLLPCLSSKLCLQFSPSQTKGWDPREERKLGSQGPSPGLAFCARALWSSLASKSVCTEGNNPGLLFLSLPTLFFFFPSTIMPSCFLQFSPSPVWFLLISSFKAKIQFLVPGKLT